jgi:hypothetical protein
MMSKPPTGRLFFSLTAWCWSGGSPCAANERTVRELERAHISGGGNATPNRQQYQLLINNAGKTPGQITAVEFGFCDANSMPARPIYQRFPCVGSIHPNAFHQEFATVDILPMRPGVPLPTGNMNIYGKIHYRDIFRKRHHFCFCVTVTPAGNTFVTPDPPSSYITWQ